MNFSDIFGLHKKYVDYILGKSLLTHQYLRNISETGKYIEDEIINFLRAFLPSRFKITRGYILFSEDELNEPMISPQIDIICVDTLVQHSLFAIDKMGGVEIVPKESVVGLFEIKRSLDKRSCEEAINHLFEVIQSVNLAKDNQTSYLPGGVQIGGSLRGGHLSNPLIGIISLVHNVGSNQVIQAIKGRNLPIDIFFSFEGLLIAPGDNEGSFKIYNPRPKGESVTYLTRTIDSEKGISQVDIIARSIGYILAYLSTTTGRQIDVKNYFFNRKIR